MTVRKKVFAYHSECISLVCSGILIHHWSSDLLKELKKWIVVLFLYFFFILNLCREEKLFTLILFLIKYWNEYWNGIIYFWKIWPITRFIYIPSPFNRIKQLDNIWKNKEGERISNTLHTICSCFGCDTCSGCWDLASLPPCRTTAEWSHCARLSLSVRYGHLIVWDSLPFPFGVILLALHICLIAEYDTKKV